MRHCPLRWTSATHVHTASGTVEAEEMVNVHIGKDWRARIMICDCSMIWTVLTR